MLGEILGRSAGDIVAEEVLCLFLLARPPRVSIFPGFAKVSCDVALASALRGVLAALNFADLAESVGVLSLSSGLLLVSIVGKTGCAPEAAAAGNMISSIGSSAAWAEPSCSSCFADIDWLLGIFINVAGVTGSLAVAF